MTAVSKADAARTITVATGVGEPRPSDRERRAPDHERTAVDRGEPKRVVVTRSEATDGPLSSELRNLGLPVLGGISVLGHPPLIQRLMVAMRFSAAVMALVVIYGGLMLHILHSAALI